MGYLWVMRSYHFSSHRTSVRWQIPPSGADLFGGEGPATVLDALARRADTSSQAVGFPSPKSFVSTAACEVAVNVLLPPEWPSD